MLPEEIEKAKKLIQQSNILSAVEKAEWTQLLADMNDKQISELVSIISPRPPKPAPTKPQAPKVDIRQKEIGTSIPADELEIPAHIIQAKPAASPADLPKVSAPKPAPKPAQEPRLNIASDDPALLQQHLEAINREMQYRKSLEASAKPSAAPASMPAPAAIPKPAPAPAPRPSPQPAPQPAAPIAAEKISISLAAAEDFAKISPDDIHGGNPAGKLESILKAISDASRKVSIYEVIEYFKKSPIYQAYIEIGFALLNDPDPDRDAAYQKAVDQRRRSNQPWLSKEEFEAFADFRKRLDQAL